MFTLKTKGGLSNCLRAVLSYNAYAKSVNLRLNVIWSKTNACRIIFKIILNLSQI